MPASLFAIPATIAGVTVFIFIVYINGYVKHSWKYFNDLFRAGFYNSAYEVPMLVKYQKVDNNRQILTFEGVGFPRTIWEDHQQELEGVFKGYIGQIREIDRRSIEIVVVSSENAFQKILWDDSNIDWNNDARIILGKGLVEDIWVDIDKSPMILIGGSTGSGKSVLLKTVLWQHIKRNNAVIIADFKGGVDFSDGWHQLTEIITDEENLLTKLEEIANELESRKQMFVTHKVKNIGEYRKNISSDMQRIIFACDEIAELMDKTGATKERKALLDEIEMHISTIARQGRAFGIHLVLATQRPDANILSGQIKNNLDCRVCGKADATLSTIVVGDGKAHEAIPKDSQGRFIDQNGTVFQGFYFDY
ncbi:MAG: DNA translocase FtsK [Oscillospiraceae bacterium]|nr:DNA translocase FtsK [Oscillospiraceae bacterium]